MSFIPNLIKRHDLIDLFFNSLCLSMIKFYLIRMKVHEALSIGRILRQSFYPNGFHDKVSKEVIMTMRQEICWEDSNERS